MTQAVDRLLDRLDRVRKTGDSSYIARCPAHDDGSPSLSLKQVDDRVLVHCFAGCSAHDIVAAVGLTIADLYDKPLEHRRDPVSMRQRRRNEQAAEALAAIRHEALVALVACDTQAAGFQLTEDDRDRLHLAFQRIHAALMLTGPKVDPAPAFPELKRPSDFLHEIIADFAAGVVE